MSNGLFNVTFEPVHSDVASQFSEILERLLWEKFREEDVSRSKGQRAFIKATKADFTQAYLSGIIRDEKPPALKYIPIWIEAFGLEGADADLFTDLAAAAHIRQEEGRARIEALINAKYGRGTFLSPAAQDKRGPKHVAASDTAFEEFADEAKESLRKTGDRKRGSKRHV